MTPYNKNSAAQGLFLRTKINSDRIHTPRRPVIDGFIENQLKVS